MEALLILLAEFLLGPLLAGLAALAQALVLALELVLELTLGRRARRAKREAPTSPRPSPRLLRALRWTAATTTAVAVLAVLAIELVWFEDAVGWLARRMAAKADTTIDYATVDGSLLAGRVELTDLRLVRTGSPTTDFDLRCQTATVDVAMLTALSPTRIFEALELDGLRGSVTRHAVPETLRAPRAFEIERLELRDAELRVLDHTRARDVAFDLTLAQLRTEPYRSRWAWFDLLFRTNADASLDGAALHLASTAEGEGRTTRWQSDALPLALAGAYVGGPLGWVERGTLALDVEDRWQLGDRAEIDFDWQLSLRGVHVTVPDDASLWARTVGKPIAAFLNARQEVDLAWSMTMDRGRFDGAASLEAAQLWSVAADALTDVLAAQAGVAKDKVKAAGRAGFERFKQFLDRRRK